MQNSCVFCKFCVDYLFLDKRGTIWRLQGLYEFQDQCSSSLGEHLHVPSNSIYYIHGIYCMYIRKYLIKLLYYTNLILKKLFFYKEE